MMVRPGGGGVGDRRWPEGGTAEVAGDGVRKEGAGEGASDGVGEWLLSMGFGSRLLK